MDTWNEMLNAEMARLKRERQECQAILSMDYYPVSGTTLSVSRPDYYPAGYLPAAKCPGLFPSGQIRGFAFCHDGCGRDRVNAAVEKIVLDMQARMDPRYCEIKVFDPEQLGMDFVHLTRSGTSPVCAPEAVREGIDALFSRTMAIVTECRTRYGSIDEYNVLSGNIQPYRIVVFGDFPSCIQSDLAKIRAMMNVAWETGTLFLITFSRQSLGSASQCQLLNEILSKMVVIDARADGLCHVRSSSADIFYNQLSPMRLETLEEISPSLDALCSKIAGRSRRAVGADVLDGLRIPIGVSDGAEHALTFGLDSEANHGFIAGQSGKGKTNLLNVIIARGIARYSPEELNFVLINCAGTGMQEFADCPHVKTICCTTDPEVAVEAVRTVEGMLTEREELLRSVNATDLKDYARKTGRRLPRIVCIVDECHVAWSGKARTTEYVDNVLVRKVVRIGRKYGIHLIASTQTLGAGIPRSLLDNIPLRIALGMTADQSQSILGVHNTAACNLERGVAVYNDRNGALSANRIVRIDYLPPEDIPGLVAGR